MLVTLREHSSHKRPYEQKQYSDGTNEDHTEIHCEERFVRISRIPEAPEKLGSRGGIGAGGILETFSSTEPGNPNTENHRIIASREGPTWADYRRILAKPLLS